MNEVKAVPNEEMHMLTVTDGEFNSLLLIMNNYTED